MCFTMQNRLVIRLGSRSYFEIIRVVLLINRHIINELIPINNKTIELISFPRNK